jgi:hypothetical protein
MRVSRARFAAGIAIAGVLAATGAAAATDEDRGQGRGDTARFRAILTGYEEVGPNIAAVSTTANGGFRAALSRDGGSINWTLSYTELEGDVQQAHIHFGQRSTAGGVSAFLCTNLGNSPGTQACPRGPAVVSGTIDRDDVIGPALQGIEPGAFNELVDAMLAGATYVNVHSTKWPSGEIRGQIGLRGGRW